MRSPIFPVLLSITVFVLILLCLLAGRSPSCLPNYAILTLNTTGLKTNYRSNSSAGLPIHDVYSLYMTTYCEGYYSNRSTSDIVDITCSTPSSYSKFLPGALITADLSTHHSIENLSSISFPRDIQNKFEESANLMLHVAFIFYIIALIPLALVLVLSCASYWIGDALLSIFGSYLTSLASTFLLIASALVTAVQNQATGVINESGSAVGVSAYNNSGFMALTWSAFGLNALSTVAWNIAAAFSV